MTHNQEPSPRSGSAPDPIVCISDLLWDEHWSSEQQLMSRLATRGRVLYVERTVSPLSIFTSLSDAPIGRQFLRFFRGGLRQESPTLTILTPPPVLPCRYFRPINRINEWIRTYAIRRALKQMEAQSPVLWVYAPDAGKTVGRLDEAFSLYYCADDWSSSDQWWNRNSDVAARENELAAKVDLIVGTSSKIANKWQDKLGKAIMVSNGADVTAFKQARDPALALPEDLRDIPQPRIGYIGFVDSRFDTDLYLKVVDARPDWHFVIVGPVMEKNVDVSTLKTRPNLHFLGPRTRAELPGYLKGFDVCTIPYVCNTWSESIFPLKLFEYLAAGRPVVATALPELKAFPAHVRLASTPQAFEQALQLSLSDPLPPATDEFLAANSWDAKAAHLWQILLDRSTS